MLVKREAAISYDIVFAQHGEKHLFEHWFIDGEIGLVRQKSEINPSKGEEHRVSLGARIRQARKYRGLTTVDLGQTCHSSQSFLIKVEGGDLLPSLPMIYRLARALNIEPSSLQDRTAQSLGDQTEGAVIVRQQDP